MAPAYGACKFTHNGKYLCTHTHTHTRRSPRLRRDVISADPQGARELGVRLRILCSRVPTLVQRGAQHLHLGTDMQADMAPDEAL